MAYFEIIDNVLCCCILDEDDEHNVIVIPDSAQKIEHYAFTLYDYEPSVCPGHDCIYCYMHDVPHVYRIVGCSAPGHRTKDYLVNLMIQSSLKEIPEKLFSHCQNLKRVVISEGVEYINKAAFSFCQSLKEVVIGKSVRLYSSSCDSEDNIFHCCPNLTICAPKDSEAHKYAVAHGIEYKEADYIRW